MNTFSLDMHEPVEAKRLEMPMLQFKRMYDMDKKEISVSIEQTASVSEVKSVIKDELGINPMQFDIVQNCFIKESDSKVDLRTLVQVIVHPENREVSDDLTTSLPDCMTGDTDEPTVMLGCDHAITPDNLFSSCLSQLNDGKTIFLCPSCNMKLTFLEIIEKTSLSSDEKSFFELKMNQNMLQKEKFCPNCASFCERLDTNNSIVACTYCKKEGKRNHEFCWECGNTWASNHVCPDVKQAFQDQLNNCTRITMEYNGVKDVPSVRACPNCQSLIEHISGCKTMTCKYCQTVFCFCCLKEAVKGSLPCGNHNVVCAVAPIQII